MKPNKAMKPVSDFNALALEPDKPSDPFAKHFIPRHGARHKGLEIGFNPAAHKEWVTGFRKRKNERKTAGFKQLEAKAKTELLEERSERRVKRKKELNLPEDFGVGDVESDDEDKELKQTVTNKVEYEDKGATTTVITAALGFGDDTDEDESDAAEDTDDTQRAPKRAKRETGPFPTADDDLDEEEVAVEETMQLPSAYNPKPKKPVKADGEKEHPRDKELSKATKSRNALAALKLKRGGGSKQPGMGTGSKAAKRKSANKAKAKR